VEEAEKYPEQATEINAYGALNLAEACKGVGAKFFQISTDYVFSGNRQKPWNENDPKCPISSYGLSKSLGEDLVLNSYFENSFIIRTAWLYGLEGNNFLTKMLKKIDDHDKQLRIIGDQVGQPTSVYDLATRILEMSNSPLTSKVYHATNTGQASWFDFASRIFKLRDQPQEYLSFIQTKDYKTLATRPAFSVLGQSAWSETGMLPLRNWDVALSEVLGVRLGQN
jgi:dTDP-4-dehydrorhamnose reductase